MNKELKYLYLADSYDLVVDLNFSTVVLLDYLIHINTIFMLNVQKECLLEDIILLHQLSKI